jgi:Recombinase/Recombinase zinc beta ribbon domain
VFDRFAEFDSARRVWLWFRSEGLSFPQQTHARTPLRWVAPTYTAIHAVLSNPVYAGAYAYGKSRTEQFVDEQGLVRKRSRMLPRGQWAVLIPGHHEGYIDWPAFEANQQRLGANTRPLPHKPGGALREGTALLQGLATCGHCGRKLRTHYRGQQQAPGYHCANKSVVGGRGVYCLNVGGVQIDQAVAKAFLAAIAAAGLNAAVRAVEHGAGRFGAAVDVVHHDLAHQANERSFAKQRLKAKPHDSGHSRVANGDPDKVEGERLHLAVANGRCRPKRSLWRVPGRTTPSPWNLTSAEAIVQI